MEVLGLQVALDGPPPADDPEHDDMVASLQGGVILTNGSMLIGLRPVDPARAGDAFDPLRVGLDHVSFTLASRAELDEAVATLDSLGVQHGEVRVLNGFGHAFCAFFDPDGIALEFTAPLG